MKLYYYIKNFFKSLRASLLVNIAMFVALPLLLSFVMGYMQQSLFDSPLELKTINARLIDEDNSKMSQELQAFLTSEDLKDVISFDLEDEEKYDLDIIVPKGYEENILNDLGGTIELKEIKSSSIKLETIKSILDRYHESVYMSMNKEISSKEFENIYGTSSIESTTIEREGTKIDSQGYFAVAMVSYVCCMLLWGIAIASYTKIIKDLNNRVRCAPITKGEGVIYEYITNSIYFTVILGSYVAVYRVFGKAFTGEIGTLIALVILSSLILTSIGIFINICFGEKLGKVAAFIIFITPVIGGGVFTTDTNFLAYLAPTNYISNMFHRYAYGAVFNEIIVEFIPMIIIGVVLFIVAYCKECFTRRKSI